MTAGFDGSRISVLRAGVEPLLVQVKFTLGAEKKVKAEIALTEAQDS
jgi:hypothetical protein